MIILELFSAAIIFISSPFIAYGFQKEMAPVLFKKYITSLRKLSLFLALICLIFIIILSGPVESLILEKVSKIIVFIFSLLFTFFAFNSIKGKDLNWSRPNENQFIKRDLVSLTSNYNLLKQHFISTYNLIITKERELTERLNYISNLFKQEGTKSFNLYIYNYKSIGVLEEFFEKVVGKNDLLICTKSQFISCCLGQKLEQKIKWINGSRKSKGITYFVSMILVINPELLQSFLHFQDFALNYFDFDFTLKSLSNEFNKRKEGDLPIPRYQNEFLFYLRNHKWKN